jgi:predicted DCC family thiol-disulfide oxidoreductase YuxK
MRALRFWNRFWFEPNPPTDLGVCRLVFFAGLFLFYLPENFAAWGGVSRAFWMPLPIFAWLHLGPATSAVLQGLSTVWRIALALSAIGLFTRVSMTVAAVLGFYLLGLPHNFGHVYHFDALLVLVLVSLACSRAGDAWSVDALITPRPERPSAEYTWPIRMVWTLMAFVFLAAGIAKLRHGGTAWIASTNMSVLLLRSAYHTADADPITTLGLRVASHAWLSRALAAVAVVVELGFITSLVSRTARSVFVPAAVALLVGIRIMMGPTFAGFLMANVFWIPWQALGLRVVRWSRAGALSLLYDGACGLCTTTAATVHRLDLLERVTLIDVSLDWSIAAARFPLLDQAACMTDIHLVTAKGRTVVGFDAYRELAKALPIGWPAVPLLFMPGLGAAGRAMYRSVADHRTRTTCAVDPLAHHAATATARDEVAPM